VKLPVTLSHPPVIERAPPPSHRPGERTTPCIADSDLVLRNAIFPAKLSNPISRLIRTRFSPRTMDRQIHLGPQLVDQASGLSSDLSAAAYREQREPLFAVVGRLLLARTAAFMNAESGKSIFD